MNTEIIILGVGVALTVGIILFSRFLDKCWEESDREAFSKLSQMDATVSILRNLGRKRP